MISTTCKDCVFKEMHGKVQTGCSLSILDRFEDAGAEISTYIDDEYLYKQVNKLCMYRRSSWDYENNIYNEVFIRSNMVVFHNEGDDLDATLTDIFELDTPKPPKVIICHTCKGLLEIYNKWVTKFGAARLSCVLMVESLYEGAIYDEAFKMSKNGWVFFIRSGERVDKDLLKVLNHSVNYDMSQHLATNGIECYMAVAYKYLKGQKGSVKEALSQIDGAIVDWSKIDENYRLYISR